MGTKQYERIFQILGAVLLAAVVVGVIAVCFGNGARSGVKREIGASDYYSQEEISAAMDTANAGMLSARTLYIFHIKDAVSTDKEKCSAVPARERSPELLHKAL